MGVIASTAVVTRLQNKRLNAGGVLLHNALVSKGDPTSLTRDEVVELGNRYRCTPRLDALQCPAAPWFWHDATQAAALGAAATASARRNPAQLWLLNHCTQLPRTSGGLALYLPHTVWPYHAEKFA